MNKNDVNDSICINITRRCNLTCPECYVYKHINTLNRMNKMDLSFSEIRSITNMLPYKEVYLTGGEPFLHPEIQEIINYFYGLGKKIYIATNALLLDECRMRFLEGKNISLLVSLRDTHREVFAIVNKLIAMKIDVECYYLPNNNDEASILSDFIQSCPLVTDYKILYNSKNSPTSQQWFSCLEKIYFEIKDKVKDKNIIVELGYLPFNHPIAQEARRGAIDRVNISTEGSLYSCPLLLNQGIAEKCTPNTCPVISQHVEDDCFKSICCFLETTLNKALQIYLYGNRIMNQRK